MKEMKQVLLQYHTVSGGSATEDGTQSVTITIKDNESAPTVTLSTSASSIAENAGSSLTLNSNFICCNYCRCNSWNKY